MLEGMMHCKNCGDYFANGTHCSCPKIRFSPTDPLWHAAKNKQQRSILSWTTRL